MDPNTLNRLGQIRHQEIVEEAALRATLPRRQWRLVGSVEAVFTFVRQQASRRAPAQQPTVSRVQRKSTRVRS